MRIITERWAAVGFLTLWIGGTTAPPSHSAPQWKLTESVEPEKVAAAKAAGRQAQEREFQEVLEEFRTGKVYRDRAIPVLRRDRERSIRALRDLAQESVGSARLHSLGGLCVLKDEDARDALVAALDSKTKEVHNETLVRHTHTDKETEQDEHEILYSRMEL